ncbi:hypothetical protein LCGC14_2490670, partial [marine sediment metagenome]
MPVETFHTLIARNKRNSFILIFGFMVFFVAMGLIIGVVWGGYTDDLGRYHANWGFGAMVAIIAGVVAFFLTLGSFFGGDSVLLGVSRAK